MNNHIPSKVCAGFIINSSHFYGCTIELWERISNFITLYNGCNYLSILGLKLTHISKMEQTHQWGYYNRAYPPKSILTSTRTNFHSFIIPYRFPNRFEIFHKVRQWHCRALCQASKRLGYWDFFWRKLDFARLYDLLLDILNCNATLHLKWPHYDTAA